MPYLTRLKTALKLPILYVTHALDEVAQLADSMVLIEAGRVIGCGPLSEIAARADLPLAQRDDAGALLLCRVMEHDRRARADASGGWRCDALGAVAGCAARGRTSRAHPGARGDPGAASRRDAISLHNIVPGEVRRITGDAARRSVLVEIALPSGALISRVTPDAIVRLALSPGEPVLALIKSTSIEVLGA